MRLPARQARPISFLLIVPLQAFSAWRAVRNGGSTSSLQERLKLNPAPSKEGLEALIIRSLKVIVAAYASVFFIGSKLHVGRFAAMGFGALEEPDF